MGTESRNPRSYGLDKMSAAEVVRLMNEEEMAVLRAIQNASDKIADAAVRASHAFLVGGRVIYVGAGTSGRIALSDAAEMPPTFGVPSERFIALIAGGLGAVLNSVEGAEDDGSAAIADLEELGPTRDDIVIGLAASGSTPYVVAAVHHAKQKGIWTCGIANNRNTPLLEAADLGIFLDTGPEVLTGSTRLKAGTSQKLVLNYISTTAMALSGKVIENLMVDVQATNHKLKDRCVRIVCELVPVTQDEARDLLEANQWSIRAALAAAPEVSAPTGSRAWS